MTRKIFLLVLIPFFAAAQKGLIQNDSLVIEHLKKQPASFGRDTLLVKALNNYATKKTTNEDNPLAGIAYAKEAAKIAEKNSWYKGLFLSYKNIASGQNIANLYYEAIETGLKGLNLAQKHNDRYFEIIFNRSLGNNYDMLDNYKEAIPHYEACLTLSENFPTATKIRGNCFVEMGDAYRFFKKDPIKAKALIEEGIKIYKANDLNSLGYAYDYLGQVFTDMKEYQKAEKIFDLSRYELEKHKKQYLIPELLFHKANLYLVQKKYNLANSTAHEGILYSQKKASIYGESEATKILYLAHKAMNQPKEALKYYEIYNYLRDSLTKVKINDRFEQVQSRYKIQKQNAEINQLKVNESEQRIETQKIISYFLIGLLALATFAVVLFVKSNRQLIQKNAEITTALLKGQTTERRRVAIDLHDNLGSTISSIRWSLDAIDKSKMDESEKEVHKNLYDSLNKAYNDVRLLAHNLLPEEFEKQGLVAALQGFIRKLNKNTDVRFELKIDPNFGRVSNQIEFELYSICLELTNNIIKHAKATAATIELSRNQKYIKLIVADNGVGVSKKDSDGKGLKNVRDRVETIGGHWVINSTENQGVTNEILVKIS